METLVRASPAPPPPTDCLKGLSTTAEVDSSRLSLTPSCSPTQPSTLPLGGPRPLRFLVRLLGRGNSRPSVSALSTAEAGSSDDESSSSIGCSPRGGSCDGGSVDGGCGASCQHLGYVGRLALLPGEESGKEDDAASCAVEVGDDDREVEQQHSGGWRIRGALRAPLRLLQGIANVIGHVARAVASKIGPQGPGENDKTWVERAMNVATCVPFVFAGRKILRVCTTLAAHRFGALFIGVGFAATLYHSTSGRVRCYTRKLDYWTIAYASTFLRAAVWGPDHAVVRMLMRACIFFKPTLVSTGNFMLVEARYAAMAFSTPSMLPAWCCHAAIGVTATSCFALEDHPAMAGFPYVHAAWHALSAVGFMTLTTFLTQLEGLRAARALVAAC